jgi:hypothetical protein
MNLKNMLEQKGIQPQEIRWDLTPKTAHISGIVASQEELEKKVDARVGYYFFISVWDCQASLMLMKNEKYSATVVCEVKEIPNRMLQEAVKEVGMINMSGYYPINTKIEAWLKEKLS